MDKPADFIGQLFLARDVAHSVHLNTRSFSKHMALNTFYSEIIELADGLAETYQGRHGLLGPITLHSAKKTANITEFLQSQMEELEVERYNVFEKSDTPMSGVSNVTLCTLRIPVSPGANARNG